MTMHRPERRDVPAGAVEALRAADPVMRGIIDRVGPIDLAHEPDLWWSLVDAIASQQLSIKAAATILGRIEQLAPAHRRPTPQEILDTRDETLRACGFSRAKVVYVKDLATKWLDGTLQPERFGDLTDEEVIEHLVQVKGIGRWSAEMVLMFTLHRPDVLPVDDLGLKIAVQDEYGLEERPSAQLLRELGEPWRPWRSIASFYLWRSRRV